MKFLYFSALIVYRKGWVELDWTPVKGASKYEIYYSTNNKSWKLHSTVTTPFNMHMGNAGESYYYKVRAISNIEGADSADSVVKYRVCDLPRPELTLSNVVSTGKFKITWNSISGAASYKIYHSTNNTDWTILTTTTNTSFTITNTTGGVRYYYKVVAVSESAGGNSAYSITRSIQSK